MLNCLDHKILTKIIEKSTEKCYGTWSWPIIAKNCSGGSGDDEVCVGLQIGAELDPC